MEPVYTSRQQTTELLSNSREYRTQRLSADDMLSTDEAGAYANTNRVTINAWIKHGRAIGLSQVRRGFRLPRWQFDEPLWSIISELSRALETTDGWEMLAFLETPLGALNGITPRQAVERGQAVRVLEIASGHWRSPASTESANPLPNWEILSVGAYVVRTQAGFKHAIRHFVQKEEYTLDGYPRSYPSVVRFQWGFIGGFPSTLHVRCTHLKTAKKALQKQLDIINKHA